MRHTKKRFIKRSLQVFISSFIAVAIIGVFTFFTKGRAIPVLDPKGTIADQQLVLILITVGLGVFVVVPVFILLFVIAWKYRATNKKAKYEPELEGNKGLEILWWGIPILIIFALAIITHISTHALDPFKPIESDKKPVAIQVIALNGNWLFVYPEEKIATLNYIKIPEQTPINFTITSDAPMNSFWLPALAGQVYAMSGMSTKLHLMASGTGVYDGSTANISGPGYAEMRFKAYSVSHDDYALWLRDSLGSPSALTRTTYDALVVPQEHQAEKTFTLAEPKLYDDVIMKYMGPAHKDVRETSEKGTH